MKSALSLVIVFHLCFALPCFSFSSEDGYLVSKIPANLSKDADAVIRSHIIQFEIKDESSAVLKVKKVVTIFNKGGQSYGEMSIHYNKFSEIEEFEGRILDANGEEIRTLKGKDIQDYSAYDDFSLSGDSREKHAELFHERYPYTVEYTYEKSFDGYLGFPNWYSQRSLDPVEYTRFEVKVPENYKLRYWCNRDTVKPLISNGGTLYSWEARNLERLSYDAVGDDYEDVTTIVYIAPSNFEIEDYKGSMLTWKEFGQWCYNLYKGRDQLPPDAISDIKSLILPSDTPKQKVQKLYKYMQSRTRYVSVQLGIGGWQPFDAAYVHQHSYGDCKALSNYMVTLLKEAGVVAYPVLINNGDHRLPIIEEFPSNQFNHVVVCVPLGKDTLWLECTSKYALGGIIGSSNENRKALMLTQEGGVIVNAPVSSSFQNLQVETARAKLSVLGAETEGVIKWTGNRENYIRSTIKTKTPQDQEKWVVGFFDVPDTRLKNFAFNFSDKLEDPSSLSLKISLPKYVTISGSRLFFYPNMMERRTSVPKDVAKRLSPVRFGHPYLDIDSIYYIIPSDYRVEALPAEVNLVSSFGSFSSKVIYLNDNELLYTRTLEIKSYSVPAENYTEYRKFFADVVKADRSQVVLIRR